VWHRPSLVVDPVGPLGVASSVPSGGPFPTFCRAPGGGDHSSTASRACSWRMRRRWLSSRTSRRSSTSHSWLRTPPAFRRRPCEPSTSASCSLCSSGRCRPLRRDVVLLLLRRLCRCARAPAVALRRNQLVTSREGDQAHHCTTTPLGGGNTDSLRRGRSRPSPAGAAAPTKALKSPSAADTAPCGS
jgi:hypothetical protein